MLQLIYLSDACAELTPATIGQIVERARQRNHDANITGVVFMHEGVVMQLLEGPDDAVRAAYDRIRTDTRHQNVVTMLTRHCETRSFPGNPMAFHRVEEDDQSSVAMTMNALRARHATRLRSIDLAS